MELGRGLPKVSHIVFDFNDVSVASSSFITELTKQARGRKIEKIEFAHMERVTVREGDAVVTEFYVGDQDRDGRSGGL